MCVYFGIFLTTLASTFSTLTINAFVVPPMTDRRHSMIESPAIQLKSPTDHWPAHYGLHGCHVDALSTLHYPNPQSTNSRTATCLGISRATSANPGMVKRGPARDIARGFRLLSG